MLHYYGNIGTYFLHLETYRHVGTYRTYRGTKFGGGEGGTYTYVCIYIKSDPG
jgi:hypothetical protein